MVVEVAGVGTDTLTTSKLSGNYHYSGALPFIFLLWV